MDTIDTLTIWEYSTCLSEMPLQWSDCASRAQVRKPCLQCCIVDQSFVHIVQYKKFLRKEKCSPTDIVFNKNKITPGTDFMDLFDKVLSYFIRKKISEDGHWQKPLVTYSGMFHTCILVQHAW